MPLRPCFLLVSSHWRELDTWPFSEGGVCQVSPTGELLCFSCHIYLLAMIHHIQFILHVGSERRMYLHVLFNICLFFLIYSWFLKIFLFLHIGIKLMTLHHLPGRSLYRWAKFSSLFMKFELKKKKGKNQKIYDTYSGSSMFLEWKSVSQVLSHNETKNRIKKWITK